MAARVWERGWSVGGRGQGAELVFKGVHVYDIISGIFQGKRSPGDR